jgi:tRNA-binding protein
MTPAPIKPGITIEDLEKIDIRAGTIIDAKPLEGSRKLAALQVDFGDHHRQILAGLVQEREDLDELVGQQALFVVNLPSRTMGGAKSEGMLFDIGYADGVTPVLAVTEKPIPNGSRAG